MREGTGTPAVNIPGPDYFSVTGSVHAGYSAFFCPEYLVQENGFY